LLRIVIEPRRYTFVDDFYTFTTARRASLYFNRDSVYLLIVFASDPTSGWERSDFYPSVYPRHVRLFVRSPLFRRLPQSGSQKAFTLSVSPSVSPSVNIPSLIAREHYSSPIRSGTRSACSSPAHYSRVDFTALNVRGVSGNLFQFSLSFVGRNRFCLVTTIPPIISTFSVRMYCALRWQRRPTNVQIYFACTSFFFYCEIRRERQITMFNKRGVRLFQYCSSTYLILDDVNNVYRWKYLWKIKKFVLWRSRSFYCVRRNSGSVTTVYERRGNYRNMNRVYIYIICFWRRTKFISARNEIEKSFLFPTAYIL